MTAFRRSVASWAEGEVWAAVAAYISILLLPILVTGWIGDLLGGAIERFIAFLVVAWLVVLFFIISPYRMWRDGIIKVSSLEDRLEPKLKIAFEPEDPFVRFLDSARTHPKGQSPMTPQDQWVPTQARFFRFKVENPNPNTIAHGCLSYLRDVEIEQDGVFESRVFGDTLKLRWAAQEDEHFSPQNIPHLANKFVDILSVGDVHNQIMPKFPIALMANEDLFKDAGRYRLTIFAASEDAGEIEARLILDWTGNWKTTSMALAE